MQFLKRIDYRFFNLIDPASRKANPSCIKKTRKPQTETQTTSIPIYKSMIVDVIKLFILIYS